MYGSCVLTPETLQRFIQNRRAENPALIGWDFAFDLIAGCSDDALDVWLHHQDLALNVIGILPDN